MKHKFLLLGALLITAFSFGQYQLEVVDNDFTITPINNPSEFEETHRAHETTYVYRGGKFTFFDNGVKFGKSYEVSELRDENGNPFADADAVKAWSKLNLNFKSGGSGGTGGQSSAQVNSAITTSQNAQNTQIANTYIPQTDIATAADITAATAGKLVDAAQLAAAGVSGTDDQTGAEVSYDNTASSLAATDVKSAIDELKNREDCINPADYGFSPTSTASENVAAWNLIRAANTAGTLTGEMCLQDGINNINALLQLQGIKNLTIKGNRAAILQTSVGQPVFEARNQAEGIYDFHLEGFTISSTFDDGGTGDVNANPALFFVAGTDFRDNSIKNVEFTAPLANVNAIKLVNEVNGKQTDRNVFSENYAHDIGRMFIEFQNHVDQSVSRYNDNIINSNTIEDIGLRTFPISISLSGRGENNTVSNNTVKNANIVAENVGAQNTRIFGNKSLGVNKMFSISNNLIVNKNILVEGNVMSDDPNDLADQSNIIENCQDCTFTNNVLRSRVSINNSTNIKLINEDIKADAGAGALYLANNAAITKQGIDSVLVFNSRINNIAGDAVFQNTTDIDEFKIQQGEIFYRNFSINPNTAIGTTIKMENVRLIRRHPTTGAIIFDEVINKYLLDLSSQSEAEAGLNDSKYMTPLKTAQAIAAQSGGGGGGQFTLNGTDLFPTSISAQLGIGTDDVRSDFQIGDPGNTNNLRYDILNKRFTSYNSGGTLTNLTFENLFTEYTGDLYMTSAGSRLRNIAGDLTIRGSSNIDFTIGSELTFGGTRIIIKTVGTTAGRPVAPQVGDEHFDTDLGYDITYNGTNWVDGTGTIR